LGHAPRNAVSRQLLRSLTSLQGRSSADSQRKVALMAASRGKQLTLLRPLMHAAHPAKLRQLEHEANLRHKDSKKQAEYLRALASQDPDAVVRRVESMKYAAGDAVLVEYAKALVLSRQGKADRKSEEQSRRDERERGQEEEEQQQHQQQSMRQSSAGSGVGAGGGGMGLSLGGNKGKTEPVVVTVAESTFRHQVRRESKCSPLDVCLLACAFF
jgi:hypothetical protein